MTAALSIQPMHSAVQVSDGDRLSFTLFIAGIVHALLILGIGFAPPAPSHPSTLDVTLARHHSKNADKNADFLAQSNQQGSGSLDKPDEMLTTEDSAFRDDTPHDVQPEEQSITADKPVDTLVVTTTGRSRWLAAGKRSERNKLRTNEQLAAKDQLLSRSQEIASLEARLAAQKQAYAKRPRIRQLSSVATREARDAAYIDAFRTRIEMIGNMHYPQEARRRGLYGAVRLVVALRPDGHVKEIQVLHSSGSRLLDGAAVRSVRLAEPFAAFPPDIRADTDILEIIRTWKFEEKLATSAG